MQELLLHNLNDIFMSELRKHASIFIYFKLVILSHFNSQSVLVSASQVWQFSVLFLDCWFRFNCCLPFFIACDPVVFIVRHFLLLTENQLVSGALSAWSGPSLRLKKKCVLTCVCFIGRHPLPINYSPPWLLALSPIVCVAMGAYLTLTLWINIPWNSVYNIRCITCMY